VNLHKFALPGGDTVYSGKLEDETLNRSALSIEATRPLSVGSYAALDRVRGGYAVESVKEVENNSPKQLVVVVDGSETLKANAKDISNMLRTVSKTIPTSAIIVNSDQEDSTQPLPSEKAAHELDTMKFEGGHDNLPALLAAAELAGDREKGAVLWIHGPQPGFNEEMYITSKFISKPDFYDLALNDDSTNTAEFLRNHREIGPLVPVTRNGKLANDLKRFLGDWKTGGKHYSVQLNHLYEKPTCPIIEGKESEDLVTLCAANACKELLASHKKSLAAQTATRYHIVTPVTAAVVLERASDYERFGMKQVTPQSARSTQSNDSLSGFGGSEATLAAGASLVDDTTPSLMAPRHYRAGQAVAPMLQGATFGTVGPQGADATYVSGLNTAGTVRVNNLANLEAALNILANGIEILGLLFGSAFCVRAVSSKKAKFAYLGASMMLAGLMTPGLINWLCASARDSNLFN